MPEYTLTLEEIKLNFGSEIASECAKMEEGEEREFHTQTYEGIIVRKVREFWGTEYHVKGELLEEVALEWAPGLEEGIDM